MKFPLYLTKSVNAPSSVKSYYTYKTQEKIDLSDKFVALHGFEITEACRFRDLFAKNATVYVLYKWQMNVNGCSENKMFYANVSREDAYCLDFRADYEKFYDEQTF